MRNILLTKNLLSNYVFYLHVVYEELWKWTMYFD